MFKFWLALILGTIAISGGLTYLKLHRGAQTISYPSPAPKTKPPLIEFLSNMPQNDESSMEISANVVTFHIKESKADKPHEVSFKVHNTGEGALELSLRQVSATTIDIYVDKQQVTMTDHKVKIPPGQTGLIRLIYTPTVNTAKKPGDKDRFTVVFEHNDDRYSDNLHFEIETDVKN